MPKESNSDEFDSMVPATGSTCAQCPNAVFEQTTEKLVEPVTSRRKRVNFMILKETYAQEKIHSQWESVYRGQPILNRLNDRCMDRVLKHLNPPSDGIVLDAGCGIGDHSLRIADRGYRCCGVDLSECVLETARKDAVKRGLASKTSFVCQPLEDLAFENDTFDAVYCRGALMHIPQWKRALANLCRVLKAGGRIAILEGNHRSLEMAAVLLVRKIQNRKSQMIKTDAGFEFWSEMNGHPFVVRAANTRRLASELEINRTKVLKTLAHEFWDINRFPVGALRGAALQFNWVYFLLRFPSFGCAGNAIIAEKQSAP
jgi:ubiquinone/menaquinone biosynthesis C-methylase UbiE